MLNGRRIDRRHAVTPVEREGELVGRDLGGGVWRLGLERVGLRDRQGRRRAVDLAGGRLDEPPDPVPAGGLQRIERAADVRVDERLGRDVGVRDGDQGREVEDHLAVLRGGLDEPRVPDVAELDLDPGPDVGRKVVQPTRRSARVVEAERPDHGSLPDEPLHEVAPDESVRAGHQAGNAPERPGHVRPRPGREPTARAVRRRSSRPRSRRRRPAGRRPGAPRSARAWTGAGRGPHERRPRATGRRCRC